MGTLFQFKFFLWINPSILFINLRFCLIQKLSYCAVYQNFKVLKDICNKQFYFFALQTFVIGILQ